jgi:hypothetical protein
MNQGKRSVRATDPTQTQRLRDALRLQGSVARRKGPPVFRAFTTEATAMAATAQRVRGANGEGGVRQRPSGRWEARAAIVDAAGRLHRRSVTADTERDAKRRPAVHHQAPGVGGLLQFRTPARRLGWPDSLRAATPKDRGPGVIGAASSPNTSRPGRLCAASSGSSPRSSTALRADYDRLVVQRLT